MEVTAAERRDRLTTVWREAKGCVRCPQLAETRTSVVFGSGNADADLMFVGEAPGANEDKRGLPFVGQAGQLLERLLGEVGLAREDVFIANALKCRPPGNRDPLPEEIENCASYLQVQLELIRPKVVATLGNFATKLLLATTEGITRLRGRLYPYRGGVLIPTFHPAAVLRGAGDAQAQMRADLVRAGQVLAGAGPVGEPA